MSDYSKITNFLSKDSLALNDPAKYVKGSELDAEFNAIAVAVATKANTDSPTLTTPNIGAATGTSLVLTGNATIGDAEATDTHSFKGATTLLVNSTSPAMTITQTGTGLALRVEDSASPDTTAFVVAADGKIGVFITVPSADIHVSSTSAKVRIGADASSSYLDISRNNTTGFFEYNAAQASPFRGHRFQLGGVDALVIAEDGTITSSGVFKPQQASTAGAPAHVVGGMYFDTTLNKLRIGGATGWETVTSS